MATQVEFIPLVSAEQAPTVALRSVEKLRTVVVDDLPAMLEAICAILESDDLLEIVGSANDGAGAVEAVASLQPELVLMDVCMPGTNGVEAARIIANQCPGTKVVLMSGDDSPELRDQCRAAGAVGFVFKLDLREELAPLLRNLFDA